MPNATESLIKTGSEALPPRKPAVICFGSAKGGSGKTILAATTAAMLTEVGYKVVMIDTDFSTRGLSLYVLDVLSYSRDLQIQPENCLADALIADLEPAEIVPLIVRQKNGEFSIILPNSDFRRGGAPEDEMLRLGATGPQRRSSRRTRNEVTASLEFEHKYLGLLEGLCKHLRGTFDFVILDTRGGYDFSSKIPAVLADAYVVVIEADAISVQQVAGLKTRIEEFARSTERTPSFSGFIVNKALFYPEEGESFTKALSSLYGGAVFGVIPVDRNAIEAYQHREIPYKRYPGSEFSFYSTEAIVNVITSIVPELLKDNPVLGRLRGRIKAAWRWGRVLVIGDRYYAIAAFVALAVFLLVALAYAYGATWSSGGLLEITAFPLLISVCVLPLLKVMAERRRSGQQTFLNWAGASAATITALSLMALTVPPLHDSLKGNKAINQVRTALQIQQEAQKALRAQTVEAENVNEQLKVANLFQDNLKAQVAALSQRDDALTKQLASLRQQLAQADAAAKARAETAADQLRSTQANDSGQPGIYNEGGWYVMISSFRTKEQAQKKAEEVNSKFPGKYDVEVAEPRLDNPHYSVCIGTNVSFSEAVSLKNSAEKDRLSRDVMLWHSGSPAVSNHPSSATK